MTRFPFSSTLYVALDGKEVFAALAAAIIFVFSASLTLFTSATSTFAPATGSYFLADSRTVTLRERVTVTFFLLLTAKVTTVSPAACVSATVP